MAKFDFLIAGGGCAGLSLAYYLTQADPSCRILIIDREQKLRNDRTWCFWTRGKPPFPQIVSHSWNRLAFADSSGLFSASLNQYRYHLIRGIDFYQFLHQQLSHSPRVCIETGNITAVGQDDLSPFVICEGEKLRAGWVFDSRRPASESFLPQWGAFQLLQHFRGWLIETPQAAFDPATPLLMDFRTPQLGSARFFYVLPMSERKALVEYTLFSPTLLPEAEYEGALSTYIHEVLNIPQYAIREQEAGAIPMTNAPLAPPAGPNILNIGTAGGAVKPTTGYAFLRIQRQTSRLARQLAQGKRPRTGWNTAARFAWYDKLLLYLLQEEGERAAEVFGALFRRNRLPNILRFLDEDSSLPEDVRLFASLPIAPFLRAWRHTSRSHPIPENAFSKNF